MPCYYTGSREGDLALAAQETREALTKVTRVACELLSLMPGYGDGAWDEISPEVIAWCKEHQRKDRQRRANERKARETKKKREQALAKLTPAERRFFTKEN